MFRFVILSCAVFALGYGNTTEVSQCRFHSGPLPINTYIEGCTTPPCAMAQGQDAIINMEFATPGPVKSMTTYATIQLFVFQFPYDLLENSVTCNFLTNASCPVLEAQMLKYTLRLPIEDFMPAGTQVSTEFRVDDESNNTLVCLRVPILIAPPVV